MVADADGELQIKLKPDESAIEDVQDKELEFGGGGGELTPSQQNQRSGVIAGGFRSALKATGLIAIISQLKPLTGTIGAILAILGRSLLPVIELVAKILRPINEGINKLVSNFNLDKSLEKGGVGEQARESGQTGFFTGFGGTVSREQAGLDEPDDTPAVKALAETISEITSNDGGGSPDQSGEADKIDTVEKIQDAVEDILGAI